MNPQKIETYRVNGFIHTANLNTSDDIMPAQEEGGAREACLKTISLRKLTEEGEFEEKNVLKFNPNNLKGTVYRFSDFLEVLEKVQEAAGFENFEWRRIDLALDSYEPGFYHKFQKLNNFLVCCVAEASRARNKYRTLDLFTAEQLSVAFKTDRYEMESYNKAMEMGEANDHSRLELRLKKISDYSHGEPIDEHFLVNWTKRLDDAIATKNTWQMQIHFNDELERIYKTQKDAFPVRFRSLTDFLIYYQDFIFSKRQMIDLLSRIEEVTNPVNRAEWHKKKYGIEYISKSDMRMAVKEIKRAMREFFEA